jgi:RNA polymerase sigma-70 factor, ECF subfamily
VSVAMRPVVSREAQTASFETFVDHHCARLVQSLSLIFLDRELAADAAQEAFIELHLHWDEAVAYTDPVAWLYRVGINRCKDHRRYLARSARLLQRLGGALVEKVEPEPWAPETEFIAIIRPLPARQRTAAALFYLADFSIEEIATTMNISEGAVNSHLHRAREALKKVLEAS